MLVTYEKKQANQRSAFGLAAYDAVKAQNFNEVMKVFQGFEAEIQRLEVMIQEKKKEKLKLKESLGEADDEDEKVRPNVGAAPSAPSAPQAGNRALLTDASSVAPPQVAINNPPPSAQPAVARPDKSGSQISINWDNALPLDHANK